MTYLNSSGGTLSTDTLPNVPVGGFQTGVFHFTSFAVPAGVTLRFLRNASNTPVTVLAQADNPPTVPFAVTIAGTLDLKGGDGGDVINTGTSLAPNGGAGGPGGHHGGAGASFTTWGARGAGPGAGTGGGIYDCGYPCLAYCSGGGGGHGTDGQAPVGGFCIAAYKGVAGPANGHPALLPLQGGSGGGGAGYPATQTGSGGGGGGGGILIASSGSIQFNGGTITARGGNGGFGSSSRGGDGAGGGVRLVANAITGPSGSLDVRAGAGGGGGGGVGRIRLEAYTLSATIQFFGIFPSMTTPSFVTLPSSPTLRITQVASLAAPATPTGSLATPDLTLPSGTSSPVAVQLAATNIPLTPPVQVSLLVAPAFGQSLAPVLSTPLAGTPANSTATANVPIFIGQPFVMEAQATFTLLGWLASPIKYAGEEVTTATVTAGLGTGSQVRYFTASGREVPADALAGLGLPR